MKLHCVARRALALLAVPLVLALAAPTAEAQKISVGFGKHGHRGSIGVTAGFDFGRGHYRPPVVVAPPHCPPPSVWVPGHYALVEKRVYVPGCTRKEYVPAMFETRTWRDYCGRLHVEQVEVAPASWRIVQDPGTWRTVTEEVWIEGGWRKYAS